MHNQVWYVIISAKCHLAAQRVYYSWDILCGDDHVIYLDHYLHTVVKRRLRHNREALNANGDVSFSLLTIPF